MASKKLLPVRYGELEYERNKRNNPSSASKNNSTVNKILGNLGQTTFQPRSIDFLLNGYKGNQQSNQNSILNSPQKYADDAALKRQFGLETNGDYWRMSDKQLADKKNDYENKIGEWTSIVDQFEKGQKEEKKAPAQSIKSPIVSERLNSGWTPKITTRDDQYNDFQDLYDRMLYDDYYGKGAYDREFNSTNRDVRESAFVKLRELWADVDSGAVEDAINARKAPAGNAGGNTQRIRSSKVREQLDMGHTPEITYRDDQYNDFQELYNRMLYDEYYGQGAYDREFNSINKAVRETAFANLRELWADVDSGALEQIATENKERHKIIEQYDEAVKGIKDARKQIEDITNVQDTYAKITELEQGAPEGKGLYDPSKRQNNIFTTPDSADQVYVYANMDLTDADLNDFQRLGKLQEAQFMTTEQKKIFNNYYNSGDKEAAQAYYDALKSTGALDAMRSQYLQELEMRMMEDPLYSTIMRFNRAATKPVEAFAGTAMTAMSLFGNKLVRNTDSELWDLARTNNTTQQASAQQTGKLFRKIFGDTDLAQQAGEFLDGVVWSMVDNIVARGIGMGIGAAAGAGQTSKIAGTVIQTIMSSEAMSSEMYDSLSKNMDPTEAVLRAAGQGLIEWITEEYSTDKFFENYGNGSLWRQTIAGVIPEAQEEAASHVAGTILDETLSRIFDHESEIKESVRKYIEEENLSEKDAFARALADWGLDLGKSALAGGISGGGMSFAGGVQARLTNYQANKVTGQTAANYNIAENATEEERTTGQAINRISLIEMARKMPEGSESWKLGNELYQKMQGKKTSTGEGQGSTKGGKKVTDAEYGQLVRAILADTNESVHDTVKRVLSMEIEQRLRSRGEDEKNIGPLAKRLVNVIAGTYTPADMFTVMANPNTATLLTEYKMGETKKAAEAKAQTAEMESIRESVKAMVDPRPDFSIEQVNEIVKDAPVASEEEIREAGGKKNAGPHSAVTGGMMKEIAGVETVQNADGKGTHLQVNFTDGTSADVAEVKATNIGTAQVLEFARLNKNKTTSDNFTNLLLQHMDVATDAAKLISGATRIRWDVLLGKKTTNSGLDAETVNELREAATKDMEAADKKRTDNFRQINPGKGRTMFRGVAYGTNGFAAALKGLDRVQRAEAVAIGAIAKSAGFDVELINDTQNTAQQGNYSASGGIVINLAGTQHKGMHRSAIATFAHEITHWIEGNSPQAYKELRTFVMNMQENSGLNLEQRLGNIMDSYAKEDVELDMYDAVAELVAKSSEEVLTDENVVNQLQGEYPNLFSRIRDAVGAVVERIRGALGMAKETSSVYAQTMREYAGKLNDLWLKGYEEAKNRTGETATDTSGNEYSFAGTDPETGRRVYIGNFDKGTNKFEAGKHTIELIQNIWSKKPLDLVVYDGDKNGRIIKAYFDPEVDLDQLDRSKDKRKAKMTPAGEIAFKQRGSSEERRVMLHLSDDYYNLLETADYNGSKKDLKNNYDVLKWHYFVNDIYFAYKNSDDAEPYRIQIDIKEKEDGGFVYAYKATANENAQRKKLSLMAFGAVNTGSESGESASASEKSITQSDNGRKSQSSIQEDLDAQYAEAVKNEDWRTAEQMLLEKAQNTQGITGYKAAHFYGGEHKDVARMIKENYGDAVAKAVEEMAPMVPDNAVLIPMPPHEGKVLESTDTMILARALSEATGAKVIKALESDFHPSRYQAKTSGDRSVTAETMGFRQTAEIPEGSMPVFIDNMVGGGQTAMAAKNAIGRGITLAYAQSARGKSQGVKALTVTYDNNGKLIPLSQRMDPNNKSWKYSVQEDESYMQAVNNGNTEAAQQLVDERAEEAFSNSKVRGEDGKLLKVYHGTRAEFNVFRRDMIGSTGRFEGSGFNFTPSDSRAASYGGNVLSGYLNIQNPLSAEKKTISIAKLAQLIRKADPTGDNIISDYARETRDYGSDSFVRRESMTAARNIWESSDNDVDIYSFISAADSDAEGLIKAFEELGYDGLIHYYEDGKIKTAVAFSSEQFKRADPVTYDDNGDVIPLSERFNTGKGDIRWSIQDDNGETLAAEVAPGTMAKYSLQSWSEDDQGKIFTMLTKAGFTAKQANKWINDVNDIAAIIAANKDRLDYKADRRQRYMKKNSDVYKYSLDASTLCAKRILYQGTYNEIQKQLPNTPLRPGDLIELANMMRDMGYQTPCGICYVESKRRKAGDFTEEFINSYAKNHPGEYVPQFKDLVSTEGLYKLRDEHPEVYRSYIAANNRRGSGSVKPVQLRTDYRKDIRRMLKRTVEYLNSVGGLRIQSFSDFETPHLIDMMQALLDMSAKGLKSQAYTKVPNFAWVFGNTGIKINLSLMGDGNGVDSKGRLIFSSTEGMDFNEAMRLRDAYSENVGTILVGMNDAHIIAAMGDDRIDFIIPFHKSGWSQEELDKMESLKNYEDYQDWQNERTLEGYYQNGNPIYKVVESNLAPVGPKTERGDGYWDYSKTGTENAEEYLRLCAKNKIIPKFNQFLVDNGDGSYSLPADNSKRSQNIRKGYWKTLIDFKMYDNDGNGAPQQVVTPNVNMEEARRVLSEYEGGANTLPVADKVVERFVREYKEKHPERKQFSIEDESEGEIRYWLMSVKPESLQTEAERQLLANYKNLQTRVDLRRRQEYELKDKIAALEKKDKLEDGEKKLIAKWKIQLQNAQNIKQQAEEELGKIVGTEGYARLMRQQARRFEDFQYGKTQAEVNEEVANLQKSADRLAQIIEGYGKRIAEIEEKGSIGKIKDILRTTTVDKTAADLKSEFQSSWTKAQIRTCLDPILIKMAAGEDISSDVEELAGILVESDKRNTYEELAGLRGLTITLGKGAQKELKASNSSLKEIRSRLAGTGITIKYGDRSTLEADIENLREQYPGMPDFGSDKDALENFVSWVEGMKRSGAEEFYDERLAEAMASIMSKLAETSQIYIPEDAKARQQIEQLAEFVKGLNAETQEAVQTLQQIAAEAKGIKSGSGRAAGLANVLTTNISEALEYYDKTAKMAIATAKRERNNQIIDQLKSKHAQEIAKRNEEWRELIERDRDARRTAEDIRATRSRINMSLKRLYNLLKNPKGLNNIPEFMQGTARELLGIFVNNDLDEYRKAKLTLADRGQLEEARRLLTEWEKQDGPFRPEELNAADDSWVRMFVLQDLTDIRDGIDDLNREYRGKNRLDTLQHRAEILQKIQEAASEIYSAIRAEGKVQMRDRQIAVEDAAYNVAQGTQGRQYREFTGKAGNTLRLMQRAIVTGNMTPEYYFRMLGNAGLSELWDNYHEAENRNGLELKKAQQRLAEIAEKYGYSNWDLKQKITLKLESGDVEVTLGQLMSLWATWKRENTLGPAMSEHLTKGGFYAEQDTRDGFLGRKVLERKAHRIRVQTDESGKVTGSRDMALVESLLSDEQLKFIDDVVSYMSNEMSQLGNEASMAAYGIKLYKEKYYFPFQMWDGVKSRKSNEAGGAAAARERGFHPSFSKSRLHGANNAIVIGDFMQTAADHIAGMINYATMGLADNTLEKVLNQQTSDEDGTKRNVRTMLQEAYGAEAARYLNELQEQLNGGAVKVEKTFYDKLISLFRKNAVAGSLSVALQQPLSYIRAATMISPKYLARALSPDMWKGSYAEMQAHSGVAVIKDMGRFDMNFGQSAREFLQPDGKEKTAAKIWHGIEEYSTKLPEMMDRMTWTRMWSAVKAEQAAQHPEMDTKSDEFLDMVGERFNDIMRRTQVYDSVLVKSANMRNQNPMIKSLTSFMAEPTLTLNVLADSVRMAKNREKGGIEMAARAGGLFILSAILQAAVKGLMGSGRTPDEKKTWEENFLYRFEYNFLNEADPLQLIPGFSDLVTYLKGGELKDDAYGTIKKMIDAYGKIGDIFTGGGYRAVEDSVGQLAQLYTGLPLKNLMRDARAMWNWFIDHPYAERETSGAVKRGQFKDLFWNADNLFGVINNWLGEAGYKTTNKGYYQQIYQAKKAGDTQKAEDMIEYLLKGKGVKQTAIDSGIAGAAKKDDSASAAEKADFLIGEGSNSADDYIKDQLRKGEMTAAEARTALQKAQPKKSADDVWWQVDRIEYQLATGAEKAPGGYYYRLTDAINSNKTADIRAAVKELTDHGITKDKIKGKLSDWKSAYLAAKGNEKVRIKNALIIAYKAIGISETEANKIINKWK